MYPVMALEDARKETNKGHNPNDPETRFRTFVGRNGCKFAPNGSAAEAGLRVGRVEDEVPASAALPLETSSQALVRPREPSQRLAPPNLGRLRRIRDTCTLAP